MADGQTYFIVLLVLSVLSNYLSSFQAALHAPYTYFGTVFIAFGIIIAMQSRSLLLKNKTTLSPYESPTALVTSGPFAKSRNPVYLGMTAILLGVAVLFGTFQTLVFTVVFFLVIEILFIPREERMLEKVFGKEYADYRKRVRKWV